MDPFTYTASQPSRTRGGSIVTQHLLSRGHIRGQLDRLISFLFWSLLMVSSLPLLCKVGGGIIEDLFEELNVGLMRVRLHGIDQEDDVAAESP